MKKQLLLTRMLLLFALIVGCVSYGWAEETPVYTLSFTKLTSGTNYNSYIYAHTITSSSKKWSVFGNQSLGAYIRVGGKNTTNTDRTLTSTDVITNKVISKIVINHSGTGNGKDSEITVNSITVEGSTSSGFSSPKAKTINSPSVASSGDLEFTLDDGDWDANSYFRITMNYKITGSNNCYLTINNVKFYESTAPAYTITAQSNNNNYGTVSLSGSVITANPADGYRVIAGNGGYTVTEGTATVTNNEDNTFSVSASTNCTVRINFEAIPTHTATFSVNGVTTSDDYQEGEAIEFPSNPSTRAGKVFKGWSSEAIDGTTDTAPTFFTEATMGKFDVTYYAVFASEVTAEGNVSLTINTSTENFPSKYGAANAFEECNLEGVKFQIQQAYVNGTKLQWRAAGNDNGTGTMYNDDALNKIQSIVLNYDGDNNKNFTVKVGDNKNPTSGTEITPSTSGNVYTFDCSTYNRSYFVMTNGTGAGYLSSIVINYIGETTIIKQYCTTIPATVPVTISDAKYATFSSPYRLNFEGSDVKAYKAISTGDASVTLEEMTVVDANVGVLLHAETADTYNIPTTSAAATSASDNLLVSTAFANYTVTGEEKGTAYVFGKLVNEVGFFKAAVGKTIGVGKSWLLVPGTGAKDVEFLSFVFGDEESETTGIKAVVNEQAREGVYDLQGRKVTNPTKGLYIVNGKKVIIK